MTMKNPLHSSYPCVVLLINIDLKVSCSPELFILAKRDNVGPVTRLTFARVVPISQRILNSSEVVFLVSLTDQHLCVLQVQIYCSLSIFIRCNS